jgi:hypothetical protein
MSYAIDHLATGFVKSLNDPLKDTIHDKVDEVRYATLSAHLIFTDKTKKLVWINFKS